MPDFNDNRTSLMRVRLGRAHECLESASREIAAGAYKEAANRSYYCMFHSIRAVLALDGVDFRKHSGVIADFNQRYIKTGIFPKEFSKTIRNAFEVRNDSDYDDYYVISKEEVAQQIRNAESFLEAVEKYVVSIQDEHNWT
ncbi:MAG: HEPN domain-containing protein [Oscillospiraceae bacterium]|nr:HEPN domain-containing protein [Oscillospiraceae bacterium]